MKVKNVVLKNNEIAHWKVLKSRCSSLSQWTTPENTHSSPIIVYRITRNGVTDVMLSACRRIKYSPGARFCASGTEIVCRPIE